MRSIWARFVMELWFNNFNIPNNYKILPFIKKTMQSLFSLFCAFTGWLALKTPISAIVLFIFEVLNFLTKRLTVSLLCSFHYILLVYDYDDLMRSQGYNKTWMKAIHVYLLQVFPNIDWQGWRDWTWEHNSDRREKGEMGYLVFKLMEYKKQDKKTGYKVPGIMFQ